MLVAIQQCLSGTGKTGTFGDPVYITCVPGRHMIEVSGIYKYLGIELRVTFPNSINDDVSSLNGRYVIGSGITP